MHPGRRKSLTLTAAIAAVSAAGGLVWYQHHRQQPSSTPSTVDPASAANDSHFHPGRDARHTPNAPHADPATRRRLLARALIHATPGQPDPNAPDLNALSPDDLQGLLDALGPELSGQSTASRVFCYQQVLGALQARDPGAGLASLERLRANLPPGEIPQVWVQLTGIYFSSLRGSDLSVAAGWLSDHAGLFEDIPASNPSAPGHNAETAYHETAAALALTAARENLDSGFRTLDDLGLPRATILPALARQLDSADDWTRILAEFHRSSGNNNDGGSGGNDGTGTLTATGQEILTAANARIGQFSAEEGRAWLAAAPFSQAELENILTHIEAGPIQDPQPWLDWMSRRLTPAQTARVRQAWEARTAAVAGQ